MDLKKLRYVSLNPPGRIHTMKTKLGLGNCSLDTLYIAHIIFQQTIMICTPGITGIISGIKILFGFQGSIEIVFCHDHSNYEGNRCARTNCRYLHASAEEEREYKQSGYLPPHVRDQLIRKGIAVDLPSLYGGKPICKDFLKVL